MRRYATGTRGPGGFPAPVNPAREGTVFYRWSEVAPWLREQLDIDLPEVDLVYVVVHRGRVPHMSALTDLLAA